MSNATRSGHFYANLEALRGAAALMVALFHVGQFYYFAGDGTRHNLIALRDDPSGTWLDLVFRCLGNGAGAVVIFFVLSGFVLTLALEKGQSGLLRDSARFLVGRLFRIYPAVISTIALFSVLYVFTGLSLTSPDQFFAWPVFLNLTLLRTSIDPVMWSMQLEMIAAPLLLFTFVAWRDGSKNILFVTLATVVGLSFVGGWMHFLPYFGQMHAFLFGMTAYLYGRKIINAVSHPKFALLLAVGGFVLSRPVLGQGSIWAILLEAIFGSFIVALLAFGPMRSFGILDRTFRSLGRVSFSFYLLHAFVLSLLPLAPPYIAELVRINVPDLLVAIIIFVVSTLFVAPIAALQFRFVEVPGIHLGRTLLERVAKTNRGQSIPIR